MRLKRLSVHINQLLPVVRYWLPHVRIVRPTQWHEELIGSLRKALELWDPPHSHLASPLE